MVLEATTVAIVTATFLLAGTVKGIIGLGLPTVSLALLTVVFDLPTAMSLLLVPSFVTNLWQSIAGGHAKAILLRLWPFLVMATLTVWIGAAALVRVNVVALTGLLGGLLVVYAGVNLAGLRIEVPKRHEIWVGPFMGSLNGVFTGMTGSFVVPGVMFLQAIGLSRDTLVQAMGILFTASTLALAVALNKANMRTAQHGLLSTLAVVPAILGMLVGQRTRATMSEGNFRKVFFIAILALGMYIVVGAIVRLI